METIWVIGAGRFGRHAVEELTTSDRPRRFLLVDPDRESLRRAEGEDRTLEVADGVAFLAERLAPGRAPDWIVPALPVHLAAEWCLWRAGPAVQRVGIPDSVVQGLPHAERGAAGDVYVSHADFACPVRCPEPRELCTVTRLPRQRDMFQVLADLRAPPFRPLVIRSYQLGPGVGGYRPDQLFQLLERVRATRGSMLVGTACRCHGVVTGVAAVA